MRIEFLWFDGCPNHDTARRLLTESIDELGIDVSVEEIQEESDEAAQAQRFQGSPSIRINGDDVDPISPEEMPYGMACRIYSTPDGPKGWPAKEMIHASLVAAQSEGARRGG